MKFVPIRYRIALSFTLIVLVTSIAVALLAIDSGRRDTESLTTSLHRQASENVHNQTDAFLSTPQKINQENLQQFSDGLLRPSDRDGIGKRFLSQLLENPQVISMEFADENKNDFGPSRDIFEVPLSFGISDASTGYNYLLYQVDENGNRGKILFEIPNYDPRERSWYIEGAKGGQTWTPIYLWPNGDVGIDAIAPVKKDGKLIGVVDTALTLKQIGTFLKSIDLTPNSQVYILEKSGLIVAGSDIDNPFTQDGNELLRVAATESDSLNLKNTMEFLSSKNIKLEDIKTPGQSFFDTGRRQLISVNQYTDEYGLDWRIILTTPESEMMGNLRKGSQITIFVISLSILASVLTAFLVASWITTPLTKLSKFAEKLSRGEWDQKVDIYRNDEVGVLAESFREMSLRLKELDRAKTEFIGLASHQLRTPLSAIKWNLETLIDRIKAGETKFNAKDMEAVYISNERMIQLVNALLNVSRIDIGTIKVSPTPTNLQKIVKTAIEDSKTIIAKKKLELDVKFDPDLPDINTDPLLVSEIYSNLITNAIKYSHEGKKITLHLYQKDDSIIFEVKDAGFGIPKDEQSRIFEKFYRGSNIAKQDTTGTGLGLYLSKALVELSGGKIWFESEEKKGSTFYVSLPLNHA